LKHKEKNNKQVINRREYSLQTISRREKEGKIIDKSQVVGLNTLSNQSSEEA